MKNSLSRVLILAALSGVLWYGCFMSFFVWSGAQNILANPEYQSSKFLRVFMEITPLPRMTEDEYFLIKGAYCVSLFWVGLFVFLNPMFRGTWLKRGITFGAILWVAMVPWFELYLPYNVMNEPLWLVIVEAGLWLGTLLSIGILYSFILNFRRAMR